MEAHHVLRRSLEEFYSKLSPEERRGRLLLKPAFRDAYNELVEADRQFPVPQYLWQKWVPLLGVFPVAVYIELKRMCFVNRATGERRDFCWPKQATLAKRLGVKKRQTIGDALRVLEREGFIQRRKQYLPRGKGELVNRRIADVYHVFFEVPLVPSDAVDLLMRQSLPDSLAGGSLPPGTDHHEAAAHVPAGTSILGRSAERTYRPEPPGMSVERPHEAGRKTDSRTITGTTQLNVNVGELDEGVAAAVVGPEARSGSSRVPEASARIERLAFEIGETLNVMGGNRSGEEHRSRRFHLLLASALPEVLLRKAIGATRDAVEARRAGRGTLRSDPGAYFAGVVRKLAEAEGLEFPARRHPKASPAPGPRARTGPNARPVQVVDDNKPLPREEARKCIAEIIANLSANKSRRVEE